MTKFRPNVAAVILNQRGDKILMFHRVEWMQEKQKNKLF